MAIFDLVFPNTKPLGAVKLQQSKKNARDVLDFIHSSAREGSIRLEPLLFEKSFLFKRFLRIGLFLRHFEVQRERKDTAFIRFTFNL